MLGTLAIIQGPDQGRSHSFGRQQKLTIGRGTNNAIRLNDSQASRVHCEVAYDGDRVVVTDAGSSSGTWVNGVQIKAPRDIQPGDVIVVGETHLAFQWSDADQHPTEAWDPSKKLKP